MPRKRKTTEGPRDRLARLSIRPDLVFEGGARPVPVAFEEGDHQAWAILWVDAATGYVRASGVLEVGGDGVWPEDEVAVIFADACAEPRAAGGDTPPGILSLPCETPPLAGLPARVRLEPGALVPLIRALVEPLGVHVEVVKRRGALPAFEEAATSLAGYLERTLGGGPTEPFAWDIAQEVVAPLMKAAAGLWRRAPWEYMPDHPPVAIELGQRGLDRASHTLYASIMGGGGIMRGVAFYFSAEGFRGSLRQGTEVEAVDEDVERMIDLLRRSGAPVEGIPDELLRGMVGNLLEESGATDAQALAPQQDSLAVLYGPMEDVNPTYLEWLKARGLKAASREGVPSFVRTAPGTEPRSPTEREARAMALALEALNQYFSKRANELRSPFLNIQPLTYRARARGDAGAVVVPVAFPPPRWDFAAEMEAMGMAPESEDGDDEEDEEEEPPRPASLEGMRTIYRFLVKFERQHEIWRRIEVRGDQTLDDLHYAIQDAFDWDNDHLYAFYLSGKAGDTATEYTHPDAHGRSAASHRLEHLPLRARQRLLYLFDFGDQLLHDTTLEAITPGGVTPGTTYPRVTERHGKNVLQYPDVAEEDEEGE